MPLFVKEQAGADTRLVKGVRPPKGGKGMDEIGVTGFVTRKENR